MSEITPLRIGLEPSKPGLELRQIHEHGDALTFVREAQSNYERIEAFDVDDYEKLAELHKSSVVDLDPGQEMHFGIWDKEIFKGGISLLPYGNETELKFWLDEYAMGDGVATAALNGLVSHLEREGRLGEFNIIADIDKSNKRAIKTLRLADFIETESSDDEIQFIPIRSASASEIEFGGAVLSSHELLEFANELMYKAPEVNYFDSVAGSGCEARVRIDTDLTTVPGEVAVKFIVTEFVERKTDKSHKSHKPKKEVGDSSEIYFRRDDKYRYKLETSFSIDTSSAKIHNFAISMVVINRETGIVEARALDSYLQDTEQGPIVSKSSHTLANNKSKKSKKPNIEFTENTVLKELEEQVGLVMTHEHLDYLIKILANIRIKEA